MQTDHLEGALFYRTFLRKFIGLKNQINKTLQAYGKSKRALSRWSVKAKASISIEASIAIPVFAFAFLEILSLLNALSVYSGLLYEIKSAVDPVSHYAYAYDMLSKNEEVPFGEKLLASVLFSEGYLQNAIRENCKSDIYVKSIKGGREGVSFLGSKIDRATRSIAVMAQYDVVPFFAIAGIEIPMHNHYYVRMWTGYEKNEISIHEGLVYITETGEVYHTYRDCTHLSLSIRAISKEDIKHTRNEMGEIYKKCPMCLEISEKEEGLEMVYITQMGNKYHGRLDCSALKRTVSAVPIEEARDRALCLRCAEREGR